jgi:hypothetical protein
MTTYSQWHWAAAGFVLYFAFRGLQWLREKQREIDRREHRARATAHLAARLRARDAATQLIRSAADAAILVSSCASAKDVRKLLAEGVLRVPAYVNGEIGYSDDPLLVAEHCRVFDEDLVVELVERGAVKELAGNTFLPTELVDPVVWKLGAEYPSIGYGYNVNMGRQLFVRPVFKRLIASHGLTASHPIAQALFCHAVGYTEAPPQLKFGQFAGRPEPQDSAQILGAFPGWPGDWSNRIAAARARREQPKPSADNVDIGGLIWSVLSLAAMIPVFAWMFVEPYLMEARDFVVWPFRSNRDSGLM